MADQSIGIMEGAFFVSKNEILTWINNLLQISLTRIEQLGTGAAYCQAVDAMFPGKVKMNRVNWRARNEWEFIVNFKILQQAFDKCNIKKYIDIERLSKARYQDNLEFAQWFKRFYEQNSHRIPADYQPADVRQKASEGGVDFSFVEFRDIPRKNHHNQQQAHLKERSYEESADSRLLGGGKYQSSLQHEKNIISRSKSPIIKNLHNAPLLQSKSRELSLSRHVQNANFILEHATLIQKFREIDEVLGREGLQERDRLEKIREIVEYTKALGILGGATTDSLQNVQQYARPGGASQHHLQSLSQVLSSGGGENSPEALMPSKKYQNRAQQKQVIPEEAESPRGKSLHTDLAGFAEEAANNSQKYHKNNSSSLHTVEGIPQVQHVAAGVRLNNHNTMPTLDADGEDHKGTTEGAENSNNQAAQKGVITQQPSEFLSKPTSTKNDSLQKQRIGKSEFPLNPGIQKRGSERLPRQPPVEKNKK